MKKKTFLVATAVLMILTLVACAGAPVATVPAPAPAAAPATPAAPAGGMVAFGFGGESREVEWAMDDVDMSTYVAQADNFDFERRAQAMEPTAPGSASARAEEERGATQVSFPAGRMMVTTFHIHAETMEFDQSMEFLVDATRQLGGFTEHSSVGGRSIHHSEYAARFASFTLRIPAGRVHEFVDLVRGEVNVTSLSESAQDITDSFFDNQARMESLVNHERLLVGLLDRPDADLEHIFEVHRELASVRHQIELLNSAIQRQGTAVSLATVHISIDEVTHLRPETVLPTTFNQRVNNAASGSWNNFVRSTQNSFVNFLWELPFLITNLFWIVVVVGVVLIVLKRRGVIRRIIPRRKGQPQPQQPVDAVDENA